MNVLTGRSNCLCLTSFRSSQLDFSLAISVDVILLSTCYLRRLCRRTVSGCASDTTISLGSLKNETSFVRAKLTLSRSLCVKIKKWRILCMYLNNECPYEITMCTQVIMIAKQ